MVWLLWSLLGIAQADADGDGWDAPADCDDTDPTIHPGVRERACWDGIDQDCDGWDALCGSEFLMSPPNIYAGVVSEPDVFGLRAGERVVLIGGEQADAGVPVPGCPWLHVPVARPFVLDRITTSPAGAGTFTYTLPFGLVGTDVVVAPVVPSRCAMGDVYFYRVR